MLNKSFAKKGDNQTGSIKWSQKDLESLRQRQMTVQTTDTKLSKCNNKLSE